MSIKQMVLAVGGFILSIFLLTIVFGSWYVIDEGERGVILRNGQVVGVAQPGMHFKIPMAERVEEVSTRNHIMTLDKMGAVSADQQVATLRVSVNYRPAEVEEVYREYQSIGNMEERLIKPQTYNVVKSIFGRYTALSSTKDRAQLVEQITSALRTALGGPLTIESVQVEDVQFSDAYKESIEARMRAEVAVETEKQKQNQQKIAIDTQVYKAEGEAKSLLARAEAEAKGIRLRSEALRDSPRLVELTIAEKWNGVLPTTMVPGQAVPFIDLKK